MIVVEVDRNLGGGYEDWSSYVQPFPDLRVENLANEQSGSCTVPFQDPPATPENDWGLRITEDAERLFEGLIRGVNHGDLQTTTGPRVEIASGIDFTTLLDDDVVPGVTRDVAETDKQRIAWLVETYGTHGITAGVEVQEIVGALPLTPQAFRPGSLRQAIGEVTKLSGGKLYVDFDKALHHFITEAIAAPFGLSDDPDEISTFSYHDLSLEDDAVPRVDEVVVFGVDGLELATRTADGAPDPPYRRIAALVDDSLTTVEAAQYAGDAYLAQHQARRSGKLKTLIPGLRAAMVVEITHTGHGLVAEPFPIQKVTTKPDTDRTAVYELDYGDEFPSLARTIGAIAKTAAAAASRASAPTVPIAVVPFVLDSANSWWSFWGGWDPTQGAYPDFIPDGGADCLGHVYTGTRETVTLASLGAGLFAEPGCVLIGREVRLGVSETTDPDDPDIELLTDRLFLTIPAGYSGLLHLVGYKITHTNVAPPAPVLRVRPFAWSGTPADNLDLGPGLSYPMSVASVSTPQGAYYYWPISVSLPVTGFGQVAIDSLDMAYVDGPFFVGVNTAAMDQENENPPIGHPTSLISAGPSDGVTTAFTTVSPYRPGSLEVLVGGLPWTAGGYVETDPAAGDWEFTQVPIEGTDPGDNLIQYRYVTA